MTNSAPRTPQEAETPQASRARIFGRECFVCFELLSAESMVRVVGVRGNEHDRMPVVACERHFATPTAHVASAEPPPKQPAVVFIPEAPRKPYTKCSLCVGAGWLNFTDGSKGICDLCNGDGERREDCAACKGRGSVIGQTPAFLGLFGGGRGVVTCSACNGKRVDMSKRECDRSERAS